jgi:hypothetical protein
MSENKPTSLNSSKLPKRSDQLVPLTKAKRRSSSIWALQLIFDGFLPRTYQRLLIEVHCRQEDQTVRQNPSKGFHEWLTQKVLIAAILILKSPVVKSSSLGGLAP